MDWQPLGRGLVILGVVIAIVGLGLMVFGRLPLLGRLPGDFFIKRDHVSFYFPLTTCLLVSAVLTLVMHFINRK